MAVVHPSRMGLVPQDSQFGGRSQEHRARNRSRSRERDRERDRERERDYYHRQDRWDRERDRRGGYYTGGMPSAEYLESRRLERENATANVWPSSPKAPAREQSPRRGHRSSKKHKRSRSASDLSDADDFSEEDERRRRRREKKRRSKRDRDGDQDRDRDRKRRRSRSDSRPQYGGPSEDESEDERRARKRESKRSKADSEEVRPASPALGRTREKRSLSRPREDESAAERFKDLSVSVPGWPPAVSGEWQYGEDSGEDDDDEVGPQPLVKANTSSSKRNDERAYGGALLRGEGSAMAAFLKEGGTEARIPRRGEIGLTSDQIAAFESVGYVMSGSRHRRMNAVRLRKENQVISAEEKRGILKLQREEKERREAILREEFTELVHDKLKADTRGQ